MTCASIIIDNRSGLEAVIASHKQFLPDGWPIYWVNDMATHNAMAYNRLLTSRRFWKGLPADKVLIFQHDSALLRTGIDEFLEWDYVGAPWKFHDHGGNGGLSLRDTKAMLKVIDNFVWDTSQGNEDVWFCNKLKQLGLNLAPRDVCARFSVESIFQLGTLGCHAVEVHLSKQECELIKNQYHGN